MSELKYKIGDRVRIKNLDWYNENKNQLGRVSCGGKSYTTEMCFFCGKTLTIQAIGLDFYLMEEDNLGYEFTDEMIEGKVEEESKKEDTAWMYNGKLVAERFSDGAITTIIDKFKYNKLSINSEFCDDKVELVISPDFELKQEGDKWFAVKKQKGYPKTYKECCEILGLNDLINMHLSFMDEDAKIPASTNYHINTLILLNCLTKLLICRDAYWKIAGDWKPEFRFGKKKYCIMTKDNKVVRATVEETNRIFVFPTEEIRDAFYENFKGLINECKELL